MITRRWIARSEERTLESIVGGLLVDFLLERFCVWHNDRAKASVAKEVASENFGIVQYRGLFIPNKSN